MRVGLALSPGTPLEQLGWGRTGRVGQYVDVLPEGCVFAGHQATNFIETVYVQRVELNNSLAIMFY